MDHAENAIQDQDQVTRVVSDLVHFLDQRAYDPGERLPSERDLSNRFKVTRAVVREALKSLEWMRVIDRKPNSGIYMRGGHQADTSIEALVLYSNLGIPFGRTTDLQCLEVRRIIEMQAIQLACERRTDEDLQHLQAIIAQSGQASGGHALSQLDYEFHMRIFNSTKNNVLIRLVAPFYLMSEARRTEFFSIPVNVQRSISQHEELCGVIMRQDKIGAASLMSLHIGHVEQYFTSTRQWSSTDLRAG